MHVRRRLTTCAYIVWVCTCFSSTLTPLKNLPSCVASPTPIDWKGTIMETLTIVLLELETIAQPSCLYMDNECESFNCCTQQEQTRAHLLSLVEGRKECLKICTDHTPKDAHYNNCIVSIIQPAFVNSFCTGQTRQGLVTFILDSFYGSANIMLLFHIHITEAIVSLCTCCRF